MKDLDFDELDRAVNSLMSRSGNAPVEPEKQTTTDVVSTPPSVPSRPLAPTPAVTQTPSVDVPTRSTVSLSAPSRTTTQTPSANTSSVSMPSLATKRSGRFMDVVHPSSDMTKAPIVTPSTTEKVTLTPINTDVAPEPEQTKGVDESTISSSSSAIAPSADAWPDPIEFHEQTSDTQDSPEPVSQSDVQATTEPTQAEISPVVTPTTVEPSPSPFITDAKVDKRPLGGAVSDTPLLSPASAPTATEDKMSSDPQVPSSDDAQTPPKVELPAELHSDLLAVESDEAAKLPPVATTPPSAATAGPVSISQQYKKQENSRDSSHAAMYDNAAQPLAHPAKKKSGWLGVVLIILIIVALVGVAAAAYFMGYIPL